MSDVQGKGAEKDVLTFLMSKRPTTVLGFPADVTGKREYPLARSVSKTFRSITVSAEIVTTSYSVHQQTKTECRMLFDERTFQGVMICEADFSLRDKTPFKMFISSSRKGSSPCLWNWRKDFNSAFLYVCSSCAPSNQSRSFAIGHATGAERDWM